MSCLRQLVADHMCVQEILPALRMVLSQPQRAMARQLLLPDEAATRAQLVETMLDYAVTFVLTGPEAGEGASDLVLSPPVQRVTAYPVGHNRAGCSSGAYR